MRKKCATSVVSALLFAFCNTLLAQNAAPPVRNIVLVHGAWADGSGWKGVYDILAKDGFNVSIVQEPETSFKEDVASTKRVLAQQSGKCILVAHSYGGAVITEAGNEPVVAALAYIAAHMPDVGESEAEDGKSFPSDLSKSGAIKTTADGFTYLDPAKFHEYFAADLSAEKAAFMARSQVLNAAENFKAVITSAAWKNKPSWMLVAGGSNHQSRPGTLVCRARQESQDRDFRRESCRLCFEAKRGCCYYRRGGIAGSIEYLHLMSRSLTASL